MNNAVRQCTIDLYEAEKNNVHSAVVFTEHQNKKNSILET